MDTASGFAYLMILTGRVATAWGNVIDAGLGTTMLPHENILVQVHENWQKPLQNYVGGLALRLATEMEADAVEVTLGMKTSF